MDPEVLKKARRLVGVCLRLLDLDCVLVVLLG